MHAPYMYIPLELFQTSFPKEESVLPAAFPARRGGLRAVEVMHRDYKGDHPGDLFSQPLH